MAIIKVGDKATAPSIRPSLNLDFANSKVLDPRASFTRSSTATYYDGKTTVKAEENLQRYSEDMTQWSTVASSITSNVIRAPDGTLTADKVVENTATTTHGLTGDTCFIGVNNYATASFYAKAGERSWLTVNLSNVSISGNVWNFDLTNGTYSFSGSGDGWADESASITSVGDGWYRCTITGRLTSSSAQSVKYDWRLASSENTWGYAGDGSSGAYIWGAQVEERSSATTYVPTGANRVIRYQSVLQTAPTNQPRFDHDPITNESKGLYLETSGRTNLLTKSSEFENSAWNRNNFSNWRYAGHSTNVAVAPDGTLTADTYESTISIQTLAQRVNCSPSTEYTFSCWIKATRLSTAHLNIIISSGDSNGTLIDYPTEFVGDRDDRLNDYNDWTRVSYTFTTPSNAAFIEVGLTSGYDVPANRNAPLNQWLVWGAQLEQGNYASSYIPTDTATVTRAGENCQVTIDSNSYWYAKGKGTLYVEGAVNGFVTSQGLAGFRDTKDSTTWNGVYVSANGQIQASNYSQKYGGNQGANTSTGGGYMGVGEYARTAMSFSHEYGASAISKDETVDFHSGVTTNMNIPEHNIFYIGRLGSGYNIHNGYIKKVTYYPEALDVNELIALVEE